MTQDKSETYRSVWSLLMTTAFKQDYVDVGGLRTRYLEAGSPDAPPLILLHGTGGHWEAFSANISVLAEHYHVFAVDMMGCGFTDKPDEPYEIKDYAAHAFGFMDVMGIDRARFIGVSLGSWVSARMAIDQPERVDRFILVAPTGYFPAPAQVLASLDVRRNTADEPNWENTRKVFEQLFYDPDQIMDDLVAVRQRVYSLPGIDRIMPRMLTLFQPEVRARNNITDAEWESIRQPALLIENVDHDDIFLKTARKVTPLMPNARLVPIRKVSHWAQFEAPDEFNALALEFLAA